MKEMFAKAMAEAGAIQADDVLVLFKGAREPRPINLQRIIRLEDDHAVAGSSGCSRIPYSDIVSVAPGQKKVYTAGGQRGRVDCHGLAVHQLFVNSPHI